MNRWHQHHSGSLPRRPNTVTMSSQRSGVAGHVWMVTTSPKNPCRFVSIPRQSGNVGRPPQPRLLHAAACRSRAHRARSSLTAPLRREGRADPGHAQIGRSRVRSPLGDATRPPTSAELQARRWRLALRPFEGDQDAFNTPGPTRPLPLRFDSRLASPARATPRAVPVDEHGRRQRYDAVLRATGGIRLPSQWSWLPGRPPIPATEHPSRSKFVIRDIDTGVAYLSRSRHSRSPPRSAWIATTIDAPADDARAFIDGLHIAPAIVLGSCAAGLVAIVAVRHPPCSGPPSSASRRSVRRHERRDRPSQPRRRHPGAAWPAEAVSGFG